MTRAQRRSCRHAWTAARRGRGEVCSLCGDRFPCRSASCGHLDCALARNPPPPGGKRFALLLDGGYVFAEIC